MQLLNEFTPNTRVFWLEDVKAVRVEYLQYFGTIEYWKKVWDTVLSEMTKRSSSIWIHDSYECSGVFTQEVQGYVSDFLIPEGIEKGVRHVLTVVPKESGLASIANRKWQAEVVKTGQFTTAEFPSLYEVKKWIIEEGI